MSFRSADEYSSFLVSLYKRNSWKSFSRNLPQVQNMELFDWLKTLYEIWKNLDAEVIRLSSLTGMGELMRPPLPVLRTNPPL